MESDGRPPHVPARCTTDLKAAAHVVAKVDVASMVSPRTAARTAPSTAACYLSCVPVRRFSVSLIVAAIVACRPFESSTVGGAFVDTPSDASPPGAASFDARADDVIAPCVPLDCAKQLIECGPAGNGCGGLISDCGDCQPGLRCGGPGAPSKCVAPDPGSCEPKSCTELGVECGPTPDGCGHLIVNCGTCGSALQCGNKTTPSRCVTLEPGDGGGHSCSPKTCQDIGAVCGQLANGCGGLTEICGTCEPNFACLGFDCLRVCAPMTCAEAKAQCGLVADGCGGVIDCGGCPRGFECGAGSKPYTCVAVSTR
jgi:hypothetical protein